MATSAHEGNRSCSDVVTVRNGATIATGLVVQEEEEEGEVRVMGMVAEEEGGGGEEEQQEEPEGGGAEEKIGVHREEQAEEVLQCSICLDAVVVGRGERSTARLQCGHEFHLDCIGSAFNSKGIMQCPNCRQIERGHWLYASGPVSSQYVNNDDWLFEDPYDFADPEVFMLLHFPWCPIVRLSEHSSFSDEMELSQAAAFHDVMGQNFNAEPIAISEPGTSQQGAYAAYLQSVPPSSSTHIVEGTVDGSAYHEHWNPLAGPSDDQPLHGVHPIDFHHHHVWVPMPQSFFPPSNNNSVVEQPGFLVEATRIGGVDSGSQQQQSVPSFYGNRSDQSHIIPSVSLMASQLVGAPGNFNEQFQQGSSSLSAGSQQYGGMRSLGAGGPAIPPPDATSYLFPAGSSGSSFVETAEDVEGNSLYLLNWALFGPHSPVNSEGVWPSSLQQEPPHGAQQPAPAPRRHWVGSASPPPETSSPDNASFQ